MSVVLSLDPVVTPGVDDIVIYCVPIPGQRFHRVVTMRRGDCVGSRRAVTMHVVARM